MAVPEDRLQVASEYTRLQLDYMAMEVEKRQSSENALISMQKQRDLIDQLNREITTLKSELDVDRLSQKSAMSVSLHDQRESRHRIFCMYQ